MAEPIARESDFVGQRSRNQRLPKSPRLRKSAQPATNFADNGAARQGRSQVDAECQVRGTSGSGKCPIFHAACGS